MIIKNIGYMWHRKYVDWQRGGELLGYSETTDKPVNFAYQAGLYALYNSNSSCIYIGQAGKGEFKGLYHRLKDHTENHLFCMWERFSWFGFYSTATLKNGTDAAFLKEYDIKSNVNDLMNVIESLMIRAYRPAFNLSIGSLRCDNDKDQIEWFYQKAEWEEQEREFDKLKKECKSFSRNK
jgi:hypothetical protein